MPLQDAEDVVPLLGAIVWLGGRFGGVDVVPLLGAIARGEGDDQLWGSGRGAIAGCHCRVPEGRVTTNFGEWTCCHFWVPYKGAIVVCYGWGHLFLH